MKDINFLISALESILEVEDVELKDCAIESLIEMLKDLKEKENLDD